MPTEPVLSDTSIIGSIIAVIMAALLTLKKMGIKVVKSEPTAEVKKDMAPEASNGRRKLASVESMEGIAKLWEQKQDTSMCVAISDNIIKNQEKIEQTLATQNKTLLAIAIQVGATIHD